MYDKNNIDKLAKLGDVWYEIMDCRIIDDKTEYKLYSRDAWVSEEWIKKIIDRTDPNILRP